MIAKLIKYFGEPALLCCDGKCDKAFGINTRPKNQLSENDDDFEYLADEELGVAPHDPGTSEGFEIKPLTRETRLNKWCARQCERSALSQSFVELVELPDFSQRIKNINT